MLKLRRINSKKKINKIRILLATILLTTFWLGITGPIEGQALGNSTQHIKVVVKKGDTLWNIAEKYGPAEQDIRKTIYEIKIMNKVEDLLQPGDVLIIPQTE
ncbi:LysM peptidoglycan-binding domain-containing protein [Zhaonella formicivorans]|uniref:LysM peptidoglycan-binding domain-containing protein n=1 Tax=Zhaonella formicivorans TaxID=2528593 RepID=UPI0010CEFC1F|nr:LysM peptidoglycan-binding domain-containing protein [Zhaonella formicivorans]